MKKTFEINNTEYTFFKTKAEGQEVLAATWNNGTESDTIWTTEVNDLPQTEEEALDVIENHDWSNDSNYLDYNKIKS